MRGAWSALEHNCHISWNKPHPPRHIQGEIQGTHDLPAPMKHDANNRNYYQRVIVVHVPLQNNSIQVDIFALIEPSSIVFENLFRPLFHASQSFF